MVAVLLPECSRTLSHQPRLTHSQYRMYNTTLCDTVRKSRARFYRACLAKSPTTIFINVCITHNNNQYPVLEGKNCITTRS